MSKAGKKRDDLLNEIYGDDNSIYEDVEDYMAREVLPHIPDAKYFDEDKIGAEIPFTRYFYKYQEPKSSEELEKEFLELEKSVSNRVAKLFKEA